MRKFVIPIGWVDDADGAGQGNLPPVAGAANPAPPEPEKQPPIAEPKPTHQKKPGRL